VFHHQPIVCCEQDGAELEVENEEILLAKSTVKVGHVIQV